MKNSKLYKIKRQWKNYYYDTQHYLLELNNGAQLIVAIIEKSHEVEFSAVIKAGAYFESQCGVPKGTAHLLEHIITGNPNSYLTTKEKFHEFYLGTKYKAPIYYNGITNQKVIDIRAYANKNALKRLIRYQMAKINYPLKRIGEFLEKERNIVFQELSQRKKEENNGYLQFNRYFVKDQYPDFCTDVIGNNESLAQISAEDIKSFYRQTFTKENMIFALQMSEFPPDDILELIISKTNKVSHDTTQIKIVAPDLLEYFDHHVFHDDQRQDVFCSINFHYRFAKELDYKEDRMYFLMPSLLRKVLHEEIREEQNLVYEINHVNSNDFFDYKFRGIYFFCRKENLLDVLNGIYEVFSKTLYSFVKSKKGTDWLNDVISSYIFQLDSSIDRFDSNGDATVFLYDNFQKFDYRKAKKVVKTITLDEVMQFTEKFLRKKPYVWFETSEDTKTIDDIFHQSKLFTHYNSM